MADETDAEESNGMVYAREPPLIASQAVIAAREARLDIFEPGQSLMQAAGKLLSSQYIEASKVWVTTPATYAQVDPTLCEQSELECAPCFSSHVSFSVPDNPPGLSRQEAKRWRASSWKRCGGYEAGKPLAGTTLVHRFEIRSSIASQVNRTLASEAGSQHAASVLARSEAGGEPVVRSNVGGYHSEEEAWSGSSSAWFGQLAHTHARHPHSQVHMPAIPVHRPAAWSYP